MVRVLLSSYSRLHLQTLMSVRIQLIIIALLQKAVSTQKGITHVVVRSGTMGTEEKGGKVVFRSPY